MQENNEPKYGAKSEAKYVAKKISMGSSANFVSVFLMKIISVLFYLLLFRFVVPAELGLFFIAFSLMSIIAGVVSFGIPVISQRFTSYFMGKGEYGKIKDFLIKGTVFVILFSGLISLFILLFGAPLSKMYGNENLHQLIILVSFGSFITMVYGFFSAFIAGRHYFIHSAGLGLIQSLVKIGLVVLIISLNMMTAFNILFTHVFSVIIVLVIVVILVIYDFVKHIMVKAQTMPGLTLPEVFGMAGYGLPIYLSSIADSVTTQTDTLTIGYFMNEVNVAAYNSVAMIAKNIGSLIPAVLNSVFSSVLAFYHGKNDNVMFKKIAEYGVKWYLFFSLPILIIILTFPEQIISVLFPNYVQHHMLLYILGPTFFFFTLSAPFRAVLWAKGRAKVFFFVSLCILIPNFILNIILIPYFGLWGAAIATMLSFVVSESMFIYFARKYYGIWFPKSVYKTFISAVLMLLFLILIQNTFDVQGSLQLVPLVILITIFFVACIIYLVSWYMQKPFTKIETETIESALKKVGFKISLEHVIELQS
jgi:O-antigen/teichoic acid export membrane protein